MVHIVANDSMEDHMHDVHRIAMARFYDAIGLTPTPKQILEFSPKALKISPSVISHAKTRISEEKLTKKRHIIDYQDIHLDTHNIILREIADLHSYLFIFETSIRNILSAKLALIYGSETWWMPIYDDMLNGNNNEHNGFNSSQLKEIKHAIWKIDGDPGNRGNIIRQRCKNLSNGIEFFNHTSMNVIISICIAYWGNVFMPFFNRPGLLAITKSNFIDQTKIILESRNDAYHHRAPSRCTDSIKYIFNMLKYFEVS